MTMKNARAKTIAALSVVPVNMKILPATKRVSDAILLAVLFMCFSGPVFANTIPAEDWFFNPTTSHYYALTQPLTWHEAEAEAIANGGHLVAINDAAENQWLMATFGYYDSRPASAYEHLLIGCTDEAQEGVWTWTTGEPFDYFNWYWTEPTNYTPDEDYGALNNYLHNTASSRGYWIDLYGNAPVVGIVEAVPEPASMLLLGAFGAGMVAVRKRRHRK